MLLENYQISPRKCFVVFGHLGQPSDTFGSLRTNSRKLLEILDKIVLVFLEPFCFSLKKKTTVTVNFLLLVLKCLKFNFFMLQSQKINNKC